MQVSCTASRETAGRGAAVDRPAESLPDDFLRAAAGLRNEIGFRPALARYCASMASESPTAWPVYKLFDQLHRYLVSYMLIHNYYAWRQNESPLPTLSLLQRVAGSSPRQTAGFVAALKAGNFVTVEPWSGDRRARLLRPAPALVNEIGRSIRYFVKAMDEIDEHRPPRATALSQPDRLGELVQRSAGFVLEHGTLIHAFPRVLHFAGRDCGYPLLVAVMGAHYATKVPEAPQAVSLGLRALARRFQVSRAHVGNLLEEAARHQWFETDRSGRLAWLSDDLQAEFEQWACWQMIHYDQLAAGDQSA